MTAHASKTLCGKPKKQVMLRTLLVILLATFCIQSFAVDANAFVDTNDKVGSQIIGGDLETYRDSPNIEAQYAALSTRDNLVLWERNAKTSIPMASTTKIMTALVALETANPNTSMTVTYGAAKTEGSTADLKEGDIATLKDLLICMMVPSGNDASVAIAENIAGTEYAFVEKMNAKAADLGMTGTHFSNASGLLDEGNYTTASDYLLLTKAAMSHDIFRNIVGAKEATAVVSGKSVTYKSTNLMLGNVAGANGVKTGFTDLAGYCHIASAQRNGIELYAVVFNSTSELQRFVDAEKLLNWGFAHYRTIELINAAQVAGSMALTSWIDKTVPVCATSPVSVNLFDYSGVISQEVRLIDKEGSVVKGEEVGSVIWSQNGEVIAEAGLVATETIPRPGFWEGLGIWFQRFIGGFFGNSAHATSSTTLPQTKTIEINYLVSSDLKEAA